jgi:hypothetical protein
MKPKLKATTAISYFPVLVFEHGELIDSEHAGGTSYVDKNGTGVVTIDSTLSKAEKYEVLIHELVHVIDQAWCLGLSERKVKILGQMLCQALRGLKRVK